MNKKRVVVAMSGGVDSSVTAALLKDRGLEVIGITLQIWGRSGTWSGCCGKDNIDDAKKVAKILKIPHYVLNFREIFRKNVIADFCNEYKKGRTPNPCIRCNRYIKFDALMKKAKEINANYLATGHYARIEKRQFKVSAIMLGETSPQFRGGDSLKFMEKAKTRFILKKGIDAKKDQSYVLYTMTQKQLEHTLMPLGNFTKDQVRQIAREKKLPVANRPESQDICFIPDNNYGEFLREFVPAGATPGPIINKKGDVIGEHKGIIFYTIGQRKWIGIPDKEPLYVLAINEKNNTIMVGSKEDVYHDELIADDVTFIYIEKLKKPIKVKAKIRYLHPASTAKISPLSAHKVRVKFDNPQWAITPGQAVVFYKGEEVLGGGTITSKVT